MRVTRNGEFVCTDRGDANAEVRSVITSPNIPIYGFFAHALGGRIGDASPRPNLSRVLKQTHLYLARL